MSLLRSLSLVCSLATGLVARGDVPCITLAGSSTVTRVLLPLRAGVEANHGVELRLQPTGSGRGLLALAKGEADAAMLSGPVDFLLARIEADGLASLSLEQLEKLKLADTAKAEVVALIHPTNPVRRLSAGQLQALLTGEISNWKDCGGIDLPVQVIIPDELDGVRATVATTLMAGRPFTTTAVVVMRTPEIVPLVAAKAGAVGLLPRSTLSSDSVWVEIEPKLSVELFIVARKDRLEQNPKLEMVLNSLHSRAR